MSGPTLLIKGNLESETKSKEELDDIRPIDYIADWFAARIGKPGSSPADRVMVLLSGTGTGKSTVVPPELYHRFYAASRRNICCAQPRVLTAVEIPNTIIPYHTRAFLQKAGYTNREPLVMDKNIGYQTGPIRSGAVKGIIYMTVGVLLRQLNTMDDAGIIRKYQFIMIDEAHERSVEMDLALYLMKRFIHRNYAKPDCPFLVVMSATFDPEKFRRYLLGDLEGENIIKVKGFSFPVEEHFLNYDASNYASAAADFVQKIHSEGKADFIEVFRDILIFVPGLAEIRTVKAGIERLNERDPFFVKHPVMIIELTSDVVRAQSIAYRNLFADISELRIKNKPVTRRVIIATNVAETGITIDTLKYVIEPGWYKSAEFNPDFAAELLVMKPVTQAMHQQRKGRVGRKHSGVCYTLFTESTLKSMPEDVWPDIVRKDITAEVLSIIVSFVNHEKPLSEQTLEIDLYKMDLIDPLAASSIHYALHKLYLLGFIDSNCIPTELGLLANKFRLTPETIRMILAGFTWKVHIADLVTIAAFLNTKMPKPFIKAVRAGFTLYPGSVLRTELTLSDDFIQYAVTFHYFVKAMSEDVDLDTWCKERNLDLGMMLTVLGIREEIIYDLARFGMNPYAYFECSLHEAAFDDAKFEWSRRVKHCIYDGFKGNLAIWNEDRMQYMTYPRNTPIIVDKETTTAQYIRRFGDSNPRYIIYDKLFYRPSFKTGVYQPKVDNISVLDGYIPLDTNFDAI